MLRLGLLVKALFYCRAPVISALPLVVGWRPFVFRMLATREELEASQDLQAAVRSRCHPKGRQRNYQDYSPGSHLTQ